MSLSHFYFPYLFSLSTYFLLNGLLCQNWSQDLTARSVSLYLSLSSPHDNDNDNEFNYIIIISVNCFPSTDAGNAKIYSKAERSKAHKVNIIEYNMQTAITFTNLFFSSSMGRGFKLQLRLDNMVCYSFFFCLLFDRPTNDRKQKSPKKVAFG